MTKLIFLIIIGLLTASCNQSSKPREHSNLAKSNDSLQNKATNKTDATEIDVVKATPDKTKILLENEYVRVIEYSLKPGEKIAPIPILQKHAM